MKVLLTGGSGFIGSHLERELRDAGHDVWVFDTKISNRHDLRFPHNVNELFDHIPVDTCVHLAAKVGRLFGEDNPMETVVDNVGMTALVAEACGKRGIRLAYASTSEVYGDNGDQTCDELEGPFTLPHNLYGISKGMGEDVCEHYAPERLLIFRFSMPYGPGLPAGRGRAAIINMLHQALHGKPIPVHDGAERSWCYIGDTVRAVRLALEKPDAGIFNVGRDDAAVSMLKVAEMACSLTGASPSLIETIPAPANQTVVKRLSTERVRRLGWIPRVSLDEGMRETLRWVERLDASGELAA